MSASNQPIADFVMCHFFGLMVAAAKRSSRVGARFLWVLHGELDGTYLMTLSNDKLDIERISAPPRAVVHGVVEWKLSVQGAEDFIRGRRGLTAAFDCGDLVVHSDRLGKEKLARAAAAWAAVRLDRLEEDLEQHVIEDVIENSKVAKVPRMVRVSNPRQTI